VTTVLGLGVGLVIGFTIGVSSMVVLAYLTFSPPLPGEQQHADLRDLDPDYDKGDPRLCEHSKRGL